MNYLLGAGTIRIDVTVSRGLACSVAVRANRPQGLPRMFVGRRPGEAPVLAGQVYSLCGFAQSLAARIAVLNAADMAMKDAECFACAAGLLAERVFETLRALVLHWPTALPGPMAVEAGRQLRAALAASQAIVSGARAGNLAVERLAVEAARLSAAAHALGVPSAADDRPLPGSALALMLETLGDVVAFGEAAPDPLLRADDDAVVALLCAEPDYAALPHLPGRVVETGAFARRASLTQSGDRHLARRLMARIGDVGDCLGQMSGLASERLDWPALAAGGATPGSGGYGAVECARGRLYHHAEIGPDGRLAAYRILAPTEWNFHPAGPFVATLLSSEIGTDGPATRAVSLLALLFDPCVAFEIDIREAAHA